VRKLFFGLVLVSLFSTTGSANNYDRAYMSGKYAVDKIFNYSQDKAISYYVKNGKSYRESCVSLYYERMPVAKQYASEWVEGCQRGLMNLIRNG
jgi:hypothetical protein